MKLVFLDIDGVLINREAFMAPLKVPGVRVAAHPGCVEQLNRIIRETGANIVISSTWRLMRKYPRVEMQGILTGWGVAGTVIGCTPRMEAVRDSIVVSPPRGAEISMWLENDGDHFDIESFVILDDDADMEHLSPRLVQTVFELGLTRDDADNAIHLLSE